MVVERAGAMGTDRTATGISVGLNGNGNKKLYLKIPLMGAGGLSIIGAICWAVMQLVQQQSAETMAAVHRTVMPRLADCEKAQEKTEMRLDGISKQLDTIERQNEMIINKLIGR